jgi:SWI/SNF-related matrix-associated actin-dependent regulator of chromatin subfamily A member 5
VARSVDSDDDEADGDAEGDEGEEADEVIYGLAILNC